MQIFGEKDFEPRLANGEQKPEVGRDLAIEISAGRETDSLSETLRKSLTPGFCPHETGFRLWFSKL